MGKKFVLGLLAAAVVLCVCALPKTIWAASESDLTFTLNETGDGYIVSDCNSAAVGELVIPASYEGLPVTAIGDEAFRECRKLTGVTIPNSVTSIGKGSFLLCTGLTRVTIPDSITTIGYEAFKSCNKLSSITLPSSVTFIDDWAFSNCTALSSITLPDSITGISDFMFCSSVNMKSITIPASVTSVGDWAFTDCWALTDIYFSGTETQWQALLKHTGSNNPKFRKATVHLEAATQVDTMVVFTDRTDLRIEAGDRITLRAEVRDADGKCADPSGITFQITDTSLVDLEQSGIDGSGFYIQLRGVNPGSITVTFADSNSGHTVAIPVVIFKDNYFSYTLSNVPKISSYGLDANFANFNGLFIDSYTYKINGDQSARVTFDVYNTNYTYGLVSVYTQDGDLYNVALIDKMAKNNTSLKEVYWDGTVCFIKAMVTDSMDDYRGGFVSKHTHVEVDIPQNGYIKITSDCTESGVLALVNYAHTFASTLSLVDKVANFDPNSLAFPEEVIKNLMDWADLAENTAIEQFKKDGYKIPLNVAKDEVKELTITATTMGDFLDTVSQQMVEFEAMELISKSLLNSGADFSEDVLTEMLGGFGVAIKAMFAIGKVENLALNYNDMVRTTGGGSITIQNQSGGLRAVTQIKLESAVDFDPDVALQAYCVELDEEYLEFVRNADQETYDILTQSICHTYNISLVKNNQAVQHSDYVTVYIPIPYDLQFLSLAGNVKVCRIEEDGSLTDMNAVVEDGCMRFVTNHFSLYALVGKGIPGDLDANGTVNQDDVVYLLLHTLFGEGMYPLNGAPGDIDGNETVDQNDAIYLLLHTLFGEMFYPLKS